MTAPLSATSRAIKERKHLGFLLGGGVLGVLVLIAVLAPFLAPHDPFEQNLVLRLKPPFWHEGWEPGYLLGADQLGRDYLSRLIYGARVSLGIGIGAVLISGLVGITLGIVAGYFGGWVDTAISAVITTRLSMPVVLVALAVVAIVGGSLTVVLLVIGLLLWDQFAVVARTTTLKLRSAEFVAAAEVMGASKLHILMREILPNIATPLIVVATVEMANAVLLEAALSFLGLGVQAPLPSWGLMLSEAKNFMFFNAWLISLPGACLFTLALAINLMGDGLRDITGARK